MPAIPAALPGYTAGATAAVSPPSVSFSMSAVKEKSRNGNGVPQILELR